MNREHVAAALALLVATALWAGSYYTGYSGAPGSNGSCASTCHGIGAGTITVVGFPATYRLGRSYTINVVKRGGSTISNYNASVRIGSDSTPAGIIAASYLTETYSTSGEANGVHISTGNEDSTTFIWMAPDSGVGEVKLYLSGLQEYFGGPNTELVLRASQEVGVGEGRTVARHDLAFSVEPSVVTAGVAIRFTRQVDARASLNVIDRNGRLVSRLTTPRAGTTQAVFWRPRGSDGSRLASGTYFVVLNCAGQRVARKLTIR